MTQHWAMKYIGRPWTEERHCYEWFRQITKEQFGREIPFVNTNAHNFVLLAARIMNSADKELFGYRPTQTPKEGDAVFLSGNGRTSHHIGMVIFPGKMMVLHALEKVGVVASDVVTLKMNGLRIKGFWTYENFT